MRVPSSARHDSETAVAAADEDEAGSTRGETVSGSDAIGRVAQTSDGQPCSRQTTAVGTGLSSAAPTSVRTKISSEVQISHAQRSGMRSRVTVVCAECKKQKLKCDRRIPCDSCTKRNTIARCIYTPAAIEKVDMTSINNRLRVVEGNLNTLGVHTPGYQQQLQAAHQMQINNHLYMQQMQNPFGILPSMDGAGVIVPGVHTPLFAFNPGAQHNALSSAAAHNPGLSLRTSRILALANNARGASVVAPLDGVPVLWVREIAAETGHECCLPMLQPEQDSQSSTLFPRSTSRNLVSGKGLRLNLQPIDREFTSTASAFGFGRNQGFDAKQRLALHAGLGLRSSSDSVFEHQPGGTVAESAPDGDAEVIDSAADMYAPLAAQLLSQFPPQCTRHAMLSRLGAASLTEGMSCVPFRAFCASVDTVCAAAPGKGKGMPSGLNGLATPAFSKIAEAAVGLAVGALIWAIEPSASERTSDEAIDEMEPRSVVPSIVISAPPTYVPDSTSSVDRGIKLGGPEGELERPDVTTAYALYRLAHLALAMHTARHGHAARDSALIHTYTLSAHYLLLTQSISTDLPDAILPMELPALVGALVWEARAMGLDVDPDEFDSPDDAHNGSGVRPGEGADGFGGFVKREEGDECPEGRQKGERMSLFMKEVRRRLWWSVVWLDLLVSDTFGYNATILPGEYTTRLPANVDDSCFHPDSVTLPPSDDSSPERNNSFYILKLRLLEIGKHAPARVFRSGLVPTVGDPDRTTAAASQRLADQIMQWLDDIPERFKLDASDKDLPPAPSSPPPMIPLLPPSAAECRSEQDPARAMLIAQQCDLAFHAYYTIMRLFTPTLCSSVSPASQQGIGLSWSRGKTLPFSQQVVGLKAIEPALALVHAAQMYMTYLPHAPRGTYRMYLFASRLFDAAIVLAYVAIQQPLYTSPVVLEAVRSALDILSRVPVRNPAQEGASAKQKTEAEYIVETLLKRAERARTRSKPISAGVKRKHDDAETDTHQFEGPFHFPFVGAGIVNACISPVEESGSTGVSDEMSFISSHPSTSVCDSTESPNMTMQRHLRDAPAISIRHRLGDRRNTMNDLDISHTESIPVGPDFHVPLQYGKLPQAYPMPDVQPRTASTSLYVSPSHALFASGSASASPISPLQPQLDSGARPTNIAPEHSFTEAGFAMPHSHSSDTLPLQGPAPFSPAPYQYPVPSFARPSYSAPLALQQRQAYELSMARKSPMNASGLGGQYPGLPASYSIPVDHMGYTSDGTSIAGAGPSSANFHDQGQRFIDALSPHSTGVYPPIQHMQVFHHQNQPMPWHGGGESTNPIPLAPVWDTPSTYTNRDHDVQ